MDKKSKKISELLRVRSIIQANRNLSRLEPIGEPPDGGLRAYSVMSASFLINGLLFGVINSYSVIYMALEKQLKDQGVPNSESRAALVGALTMGTTFFLSPLSGVLTGVLGLRLTAVLGGTIATTGILVSSFFVHNIVVLCLTYGIIYGIGSSLSYTPSLAIIGYYFKKYLGLVNGFVTLGCSVFTIIMPPLMEYVIEQHGLVWLFRLLAFLSSGLALCALLFKPTPLMTIKTTSREDDSFKSLIKSVVNVEIWQKRKYRQWALSMPVALFGYFVPYVHIKKFIETNFVNVSANLPLQCMAVTSGLGGIIFGYLADKPGIDRIFVQQMAFYVIGVLTIILAFVRNFGLVVLIALGMGLFDGAFSALIGPIAIELCGSENAAQAIGCMLGLVATPLSVSPPIAGYLYSINQSYTLPFVLAGLCPVVGATLMFTIRYQIVPYIEQSTTSNGVAASPASVPISRQIPKPANEETIL